MGPNCGFTLLTYGCRGCRVGRMEERVYPEEEGPCWGDQPYCYTELDGAGHCLCWTAPDPRNEGH